MGVMCIFRRAHPIQQTAAVHYQKLCSYCGLAEVQAEIDLAHVNEGEF